MPIRDFEDLRFRTEEVLENLTDGIVLVLKGHLLLEEVLYQVVCSRCPNPEYLDRANLRFFQLLNIARALYPIPPGESARKMTTPELWDAMEALNTLRNQLAHRLEPKDLLPLLKRLRLGDYPEPMTLDNPAIVDGLGKTIPFLLGIAAAMAYAPK